ncbi:MAG: ribonuclease HII [Clostridia bacterium]|nr:ribonuclease HII [Clostridia bacterium]
MNIEVENLDNSLLKDHPTYDYEKTALDAGFSCVCGIDEAGRGPLAGPVFAAAVVLPLDCEIEGLNDSKKLTEKKREMLFDIIMEKAISYSVASASEKEIDEINILNATFLAMRRAYDGLSVKPDKALIDGNKEPGLSCAQETVVKGDAKSMSIAAASILAKVSRDRYMLEMAKLYPEYQFEKHKGYGTKLHYEMIREHGVSDIHRLTFLKKMH